MAKGYMFLKARNEKLKNVKTNLNLSFEKIWNLDLKGMNFVLRNLRLNLHLFLGNWGPWIENKN